MSEFKLGQNFIYNHISMIPHPLQKIYGYRLIGKNQEVSVIDIQNSNINLELINAIKKIAGE